MPEDATTPRDLVGFSVRLLNAIELYFGLARRLTRIRLGFEVSPAWEVETAMVESFAMHTRGLADFFFTTRGSDNPRRRHDAWALHYFSPASRWTELVDSPGPWLRRVYMRPAGEAAGVDRFGAQVAHLNYHDPPASELARGWPVMQLAHDLGRAVASFVTSVESTDVCPGFQERAWSQVPLSARLDKPLLPLATWTRPSMRVLPNG